jgi:hypothetical protein
MTAGQYILIIVLLIVALASGLIIWRRSRKPSQEDVNVGMGELAELAVQFADQRGQTLDYSPDSVERVESILADLHNSKKAGQLSDEDAGRSAIRFGAYIGEVLRRHYGGHWEEDHDVAGPGSFPIHWGQGASFPVGWCGKRIINGQEDNVWHKYQVVTSEDSKPSPSTQPGE